MYCNVTAHTGRLVVYLVLWKSVMTLLLLLTLLVLVFGRPSLFIVNRQKDTDWLLAQLLLTCVTPACTYILSKHIKSSQMTQLKTYKHAYTLRNKRGEITWTKAPIGAVSYLFFWSLLSLPLLLNVLWVWDVRTFCLCALFLHLDLTQFNLEVFQILVQ